MKDKFNDIDERIAGKVLKDYDGVIGKALLEYRTGIKRHCSYYDPFGLCNVMECLYCDNSSYKITLENENAIVKGDLDNLNDSRGFLDVNHEILFYDSVPDIDNLFSYLFSDDSQYRVVRTSDNIVMNDYVRNNKKLIKKL